MRAGPWVGPLSERGGGRRQDQSYATDPETEEQDKERFLAAVEKQVRLEAGL